MTERLRFAHQFHPVVAYGDAIGNDAAAVGATIDGAGILLAEAAEAARL